MNRKSISSRDKCALQLNLRFYHLIVNWHLDDSYLFWWQFLQGPSTTQNSTHHLPCAIPSSLLGLCSEPSHQCRAYVAKSYKSFGKPSIFLSRPWILPIAKSSAWYVFNSYLMPKCSVCVIQDIKSIILELDKVSILFVKPIASSSIRIACSRLSSINYCRMAFIQSTTVILLTRCMLIS